MTLSLSVSGLKVEGEGGRRILEADALDVAAGTAIAIRGPSGAGKSTLLFALAGLVPIAKGSVRWGETEISALKEDGRAAFRRAHIGMIFQDFLLFEELSAQANASLAGAYVRKRRQNIGEGARAALERLGLSGDDARTVATFSGGERQRVAVARALAAEPSIILADEPTASLDRAAADALVDDLIQMTRESGRTLIVASHDLKVHQSVDRLIDVADGCLVGEALRDA
ncbi:putative ABC transport system ATP-binding protein [Rhodopseudomonas julia]|uniref:ABC transport system ATP-binding protein n=1 Tax=Rhodopseudomonas julia TaxID=200617 RepID=A0ABU0C2D4_9BRAD|nr:ATP-binding cassette domain-containing protein [Rhodopseudomonas julia]MDQ0324678.1 putative ABC transport system ATP-binding protein [Rhodopseudomonas julia]